MREYPKETTPGPMAALCLLGILVLWFGYTLFYTFRPETVPLALLELLPGILSIGILAAAGWMTDGGYLRPAGISRRGILYLGLSLLFMPMIWFTGRWTGWDWAAALFYAPASGISQELFFRAALLPAFLRVLPGRPGLAVFCQAVLFSLWHMPKAFLSAPLGGLIGVAIVTFLCGILWGKQVQRDRTVLWIMVFHSLLLVGNSLFTW